MLPEEDMEKIGRVGIEGQANPLAFAIAQRDRDILSMVRRSLDRGNVLLAYQPVVDARRPDRTAFYEGLIRVIDDTGRIIPASDFMEACEAHEVGRIIDCLALEFGLSALACAPSLRLAVNMSARSIGYPRWMETLERGLAAAPHIGERMIVEITESSAILMPDITMVFMQRLQDRGVAFALDDFGAGYTAFRYLRDLDFDIVKIAGEFITGIHDNPDNRVLTSALVSIARQFDMLTVAEAVESAAEARLLAEIGVDCLQGFYFGVPSTRPRWPEFPQSLRSAG
ncbi:EAL domain-containing protein [Tropicimonas sediminicola]|uniref:EAL domain, c-di-GMP-specific phosphodiesterase class I (Or its enzymatically inactive variant) n=1 Tax=Tropicimonas sediminicola TaxID=1031541 RepID=A0A239C6E6_9RHOB|nr:EAL domain-containing protein [Tropicimonas sediminicola]SNS15807.1 EAL domain, c-di-GMP-specific phosphodiesterase class I (or its enzymatically inactive variant) [Tropicimonas sediminicola]